MMKHLEHIMQREMTRKEFLATLGFGLISVMGVGTLVRLLLGKDNAVQHLNSASTYGGSTYGRSRSSTLA